MATLWFKIAARVKNDRAILPMFAFINSYLIMALVSGTLFEPHSVMLIAAATALCLARGSSAPREDQAVIS